jgi:flavodoxin
LRVIIVYYSKTGNTETISNAIKEALKASHEVAVFRIEMVREYSNRLLHLNPRVLLDLALSRRPRIKPVMDMSSYDLIFVGTPNWYGQIAPPMNTFIQGIATAEGKKAMVFVSSGLGRESYADDLRGKLEEKGFKVLKGLSLMRGEIGESQLREIREILA